MQEMTPYMIQKPISNSILTHPKMVIDSKRSKSMFGRYFDDIKHESEARVLNKGDS
jgi:hypothetical protein